MKKLTITFIDKNFQMGVSWKFKKKQLKKLIEKEWKDYMIYALDLLKKSNPKGYKNIKEFREAQSDFWKKHPKSWFRKKKWKEVQREMPKFKSTVSARDVRIIFWETQNVSPYETASFEKLKLIIKKM